MCRYIWDMGYTSRDAWREWPQGETLCSWAVGGRLTMRLTASLVFLSPVGRRQATNCVW